MTDSIHSNRHYVAGVIDALIAVHNDKWKQAKNNPKLLGWFVGQVMKHTNGGVNPDNIHGWFERKLHGPR